MLIDMSISGGILIVLAVILRKFAIKILPKRFFMLLWEIILLRLLIPFNLPFSYGVTVPFLKLFQSIGKILGGVSGSGDKLQIRSSVDELSFELTQGVHTENMNIDIVLLGWGIVTIALSTFFGVSYYKEYKRLKMALPIPHEFEKDIRQMNIVPKRVKLCVSDQIATPMTFGIISPKIIFPKMLLLSKKAEIGGVPDTDERTDIKYVLMHECMHIRYADNLWKMIMILAICIHWFNPLVPLMYILMNRDIEMACDEQVISEYGEKYKQEYAMAIINLAEKQYNWSFFSSGFGENVVKERIVAIMKFKKITAIGTISAVVLLAGAVTVFSNGGMASAFTVSDQKGVILSDKPTGKTKQENEDIISADKEVGKTDEKKENKVKARNEEVKGEDEILTDKKASEKDEKREDEILVDDKKENQEVDASTDEEVVDGMSVEEARKKGYKVEVMGDYIVYSKGYTGKEAQQIIAKAKREAKKKKAKQE